MTYQEERHESGRRVRRHLTPSDLAIAASQQARAPKRLALLPRGRFAAYVEGFDQASGAARDWFTEPLIQREEVAT